MKPVKLKIKIQRVNGSLKKEHFYTKAQFNTFVLCLKHLSLKLNKNKITVLVFAGGLDLKLNIFFYRLTYTQCSFMK